jgi:hypothetical protein
MPFCKSKAPVLSIKEQNSSLGSVDNKEEKSCTTSLTASGCSENWMPENTVTKEQNDVSGNTNVVEETQPHIQSPWWTCFGGSLASWREECYWHDIYSVPNRVCSWLGKWDDQ